jgi:hypothetical protein
MTNKNLTVLQKINYGISQEFESSNYTALATIQLNILAQGFSYARSEPNKILLAIIITNNLSRSVYRSFKLLAPVFSLVLFYIQCKSTGAKMTKSSIISSEDNSALSQNYQSIFSSITSLEEGLYNLLNHFNLLSKQEQNKLFIRLENFHTNLHFFNEFFGAKSDNKSAIKTDNNKFLCVQEGEKLVIMVINNDQNTQSDGDQL